MAKRADSVQSLKMVKLTGLARALSMARLAGWARLNMVKKVDMVDTAAAGLVGLADNMGIRRSTHNRNIADKSAVCISSMCKTDDVRE